jgi:hypothetical protein
VLNFVGDLGAVAGEPDRDDGADVDCVGTAALGATVVEAVAHGLVPGCAADPGTADTLAGRREFDHDVDGRVLGIRVIAGEDRRFFYPSLASAQSSSSSFQAGPASVLWTHSSGSAVSIVRRSLRRRMRQLG